MDKNNYSTYNLIDKEPSVSYIKEMTNTLTNTLPDVKESISKDSILYPKIHAMNYELLDLNLSQISKIQCGHKLYVDKDKEIINIDNRTFSSIRRYLYGDSRENELDFIKLLIEKSIAFCKKHKSSVNNEQYRQYQTILAGLICAKAGLTNFKITYIDDQLFQSQIDAITKLIDNNTSDCNKFITE